MPPPRKRALKAVPDSPVEVPEKPVKEKPSLRGENSPVAKWNRAGRPIGKNLAKKIAQAEFNSGPDMPPGKSLSWLPTAEEVPPKPKEPPQMEYPGIGYVRIGNPEWQLYSEIAPDARDLAAEGKPWILWREWRVRWVPPEEKRCQARSIGKFSEYMGNRCTMKSIRGGRVCISHGGKLATVKKAAQAALAVAALPAAEKLIHIALTKRGVADSDRIKAIVQILDRAGVEGKQTIEIEVAPWQKVLERVYAAETGSVIDAEEVEGLDYELDDDRSPGYQEDDDGDD